MMNDKTKLVKEAKNDKASRCWFAYQKKIKQKMGLGEMGLGEMLPNPPKYLSCQKPYTKQFHDNP